MHKNPYDTHNPDNFEEDDDWCGEYPGEDDYGYSVTNQDMDEYMAWLSEKESDIDEEDIPF